MNTIKEEITVSTGVKFGIRDVPIMPFRQLQKRLERGRPHVPVTYIEDKDRSEENPEDPDYLEALDDWNEDMELKLMDYVFMTGTEVLEVPEGVRPMTDETWADECRYLGEEIASEGGVRYIQWLKYVACPNPDDIKAIVMPAVRSLGVTEEDVAESAAMFQNRKERRANPRASGKARSK